MTLSKREQQRIRSAWLIGILFCAVIFAGGCTKVYITEQEVHQRIKSGLPPGSTYSQVNDFLRKNNWGGESEIIEFEGSGTHANMLTEVEKRKIKWQSAGGIQLVEKDLMWSWAIVMRFYYDQDKKLVTYNLVKGSY